VIANKNIHTANVIISFHLLNVEWLNVERLNTRQIERQQSERQKCPALNMSKRRIRLNIEKLEVKSERRKGHRLKLQNIYHDIV
jgi:hypothetical protein